MSLSVFTEAKLAYSVTKHNTTDNRLDPSISLVKLEVKMVTDPHW